MVEEFDRQIDYVKLHTEFSDEWEWKEKDLENTL